MYYKATMLNFGASIVLMGAESEDDLKDDRYGMQLEKANIVQILTKEQIIKILEIIEGTEVFGNYRVIRDG